MATSGLYGNTAASVVALPSGSETSGLYGNNTVFGGTYFEWFIFQDSATQSATPTGGSWDFTTNLGTPPTGWSNQPPVNPIYKVWISIALVNSRSSATYTWSTPGLMSAITNGTVTSVGLSAPSFLSVSGSPVTNSGTLALSYSGTALPVANGGTGTTTPSLVAGTNVTISGTWPNQTINSTASGGGTGTVTSVAATVPSFLSVTGSPITTSGTLGITYSGTALPVANGGTGVTVSTGANSVVLRDANQNITTNAINDGYLNTTASGTSIILTADSIRRYTINGSGGQIIQLPNATTLANGAIFEFDNNQTSGAVTVNNNSGTLVVSVPSGGIVRVDLLSNAIAAGSWDKHSLTPSNVSWSTNTFDYPGSITSATWNGATVAYNRGGTGQSANFVAGGIVYGSTTTAMAVTPIGTSGQVLTSAGAGTPTWTTPTTGTVTSVAALTLGTTGTDLSSSVANGSTTPVITLNVPTASASNRGVLSSADWTTFNSKGSGTVTSVGGTGTVSGISLSGTVTSSGNLTLGGTLDLSSPPAIGSTAANTGAFTTLSASSTVSGTGFSTYLASPPAIGGTAAAAGSFTTLTATTSVTTPIVQNSAAAAIPFKTNSATSAITQFNVDHTNSAVNYVQVTGGTTVTKTVTVSAQGSDTDVDLALAPKGAGRVTVSTSIKPKVSSAANVTSPLAWNSTSFDEYAITALANALTINADANASPADGQRMLFRFKDNGTARALTWTTGATNAFRAVGVTLPTTTVASKLVYIGCIYNSADSRWDAVAVSQEA